MFIIDNYYHYQWLLSFLSIVYWWLLLFLVITFNIDNYCHFLRLLFIIDDWCQFSVIVIIFYDCYHFLWLLLSSIIIIKFNLFFNENCLYKRLINYNINKRFSTWSRDELINYISNKWFLILWIFSWWNLKRLKPVKSSHKAKSIEFFLNSRIIFIHKS